MGLANRQKLTKASSASESPLGAGPRRGEGVGIGSVEEASPGPGDRGSGAGGASGPAGPSFVPGTADRSGMVLSGEVTVTTPVLFSQSCGGAESPSPPCMDPISSRGRSRKTIFITCSTTPGSSDSKVIWALLGRVMDTFTIATPENGLPVGRILPDGSLVINLPERINVVVV